MLTLCKQIMRGLCAELDVEFVELPGEADHVHMLLAYTPTLTISVLERRLKDRTLLRREFTRDCVRAHMRTHRWSPS